MPQLKTDVTKAAAAIGATIANPSDHTITVSGNLNSDQIEELFRTLRATTYFPSLVAGVLTFKIR